MTQPSIEDGYEYWHQEVGLLERAENAVRYIPIIALVGVYAVCGRDPEQLTSYHWRRSVLDSPSAIAGLRLSLPGFDGMELDETYEIPLDHLSPDESVVGGQLRHAHASLLHGLPKDVTSLPQNEIFLGETLGFAHYDQGVKFHPQLGLTDQGLYAVHGNYPKTAKFVEMHTA